MTKSRLNELRDFLTRYRELLLVPEKGNPVEMTSVEIEIEEFREKLLVTFLGEKGMQTWRIAKSTLNESSISFNLTRNFETEKKKIKLIARVGADDLIEEITLQRSIRANEIASDIAETFSNTKLIRVELNKDNGRFAQIVFETGGRVRIAALADVSESAPPENLLSFAIIWLLHLLRRKKDSINSIWILARKPVATKLQKLVACLSERHKSQISILELKGKSSKRAIAQLPHIEIKNLWRQKPKKLTFPNKPRPSDISREITKLAPKEIDIVVSKNGELLRYLGLPFLRTRVLLGKEQAWFGVERVRNQLVDGSYDDFYEFFEEIKKYRRFDSPNKQHIFYQSSPEAWLESMLKQNIKLLDANLILSPLYNQFRMSREKIDLLALRKDGRLVIIELKVAEDRDMIFQAVDYWRKIELQRKKGVLDKAHLFGKKEIADKPTIIYLVAPKLRYHRDFDFLAKSISKMIEIFRFDLCENWREDLKVISRWGL